MFRTNAHRLWQQLDCAMTTNATRSARLTAAPFAVLVVALAACGSTADVSSGAPGDDADEPAAPTTTVVLDAGGPDRAVVTIGRQRYVADLSDQLSICRVDQGAISGVGQIEGFADGRLHIELPPQDWDESDGRFDPPSIALDLGTDADDMAIGLYAGGDVAASVEGFAEVSRIESFVIDGRRASGVATFVDLDQVEAARDRGLTDPEGRTGTFAIECG